MNLRIKIALISLTFSSTKLHLIYETTKYIPKKIPPNPAYPWIGGTLASATPSPRCCPHPLQMQARSQVHGYPHEAVPSLWIRSHYRVDILTNEIANIPESCKRPSPGDF